MENESHSIQIPTEKQNVVPKTFDAKEIHDGKPVMLIFTASSFFNLRTNVHSIAFCVV